MAAFGFPSSFFLRGVLSSCCIFMSALSIWFWRLHYFWDKETLQDSFWIIICSSRILIISGSRHQSSSSTGQAAWTCYWLCVFGQDQTHGLKGTDYRQWQFWNIFAKNIKVIEMSGSLVYLFRLLLTGFFWQEPVELMGIYGNSKETSGTDAKSEHTKVKMIITTMIIVMIIMTIFLYISITACSM